MHQMSPVTPGVAQVQLRLPEADVRSREHHTFTSQSLTCNALVGGLTEPAIGGADVTQTRVAPLGLTARIAKRTLDLVGGLIGLALLGPLMVLMTLAIKLDSGGRAFFRQTRIGRDGVPFTMWKFRTMVDGADELKPSLLALNEADGLFKIAHDPRVTPVGRWLRATSLDELPQLFNVIRGDMSLVGPRPLVPEDDVLVTGAARRRLKLTPGMTGTWQIVGSALAPLSEMTALDCSYVDGWSLWMDLKILLRTVPYVVGRRGM
jgi:lipopolysaccharide/colanic/teichoic acid biosynthesis glycosyltransferase